MTNEEKIKKWLAGELSESEKKEFESTEEFAELSKLMNAVQNFKAPVYNEDSEYKRLSGKVFPHKQNISLYERINPLLKIAAIFIVALTIGYFSYTYFNPATNNREWISEQTDIHLPDSSFVVLNAGSEIRYSDKKWNKVRNVELKGEAFFRVKEGARFNVKTQHGTVTVLGTEFTVKDREDYYRVSCYSGSVKVSAGESSIVLRPNSAFRILKGKQETYTFSGGQGPDWLNGESSFKSVPLEFVIDELERQYKVTVETRNVDLNRLFTGSFSHEDLEIALKSVTLPLNLNYEIKDNIIVITVEGI